MFYLLPLTGYCFSSANNNLAGRELTSGLAKGMLLVFTKYNEPSYLIINKPGSQNTSASASLIDLEMYKFHSLALSSVKP